MSEAKNTRDGSDRAAAREKKKVKRKMDPRRGGEAAPGGHYKPLGGPATQGGRADFVTGYFSQHYQKCMNMNC